MIESLETIDRADVCGSCGTSVGRAVHPRTGRVPPSQLLLRDVPADGADGAAQAAMEGAAPRDEGRHHRRRGRGRLPGAAPGVARRRPRRPPARPPPPPARPRASLPAGWFGPEWPPSDTSLLAALGRDAWIHPLAGPVRRMPIRDSRVFGAVRPGNRAVECRNGHCGVDLGGEIWGEHIRAVHDGVVDFVRRGPNEQHGGQFVRISHRGGTVFTQYFHVAAIPRRIERGVVVKGGDVVGLLGDTGVKDSAPHLHFSISIRPSPDRPEKYFDPEPLMALWPLRVPLEGSERGPGHDGLRARGAAGVDAAALGPQAKARRSPKKRGAVGRPRTRRRRRPVGGRRAGARAVGRLNRRGTSDGASPGPLRGLRRQAGRRQRAGARERRAAAGALLRGVPGGDRGEAAARPHASGGGGPPSARPSSRSLLAGAWMVKRHRAPQRHAISYAWPETDSKEQPAPRAGPRFYGPAWPPTDDDWMFAFGRVSWTYPLPGPERRAPVRGRPAVQSRRDLPHAGCLRRPSGRPALGRTRLRGAGRRRRSRAGRRQRRPRRRLRAHRPLRRHGVHALLPSRGDPARCPARGPRRGRRGDRAGRRHRHRARKRRVARPPAFRVFDPPVERDGGGLLGSDAADGALAAARAAARHGRGPRRPGQRRGRCCAGGAGASAAPARRSDGRGGVGFAQDRRRAGCPR